MYSKKILVSGGCGFFGNHLIRHLVKTHKDWLIINLDCLSYAGVIDNLKDIENEENYRFEYGDITDEFLLSAIFANYDITDVIHLAAESHVDRSLSAPMKFLFSNTVGTVTLLESARQYWSHHGGLAGHKFYYFSTDEVFGYLNDGDDGFTEKSQIKPSSPYSASKAAGDLFVDAYHKTYGLETNISHCCNIIGPRQMMEKLVPATIDRILNDEPIIVYDKGEQVREWIYTDDVLDAAMTVFEKGVPGEAYNIGSGNEMQNINLILMIMGLVAMKSTKDFGEYSKAFDKAKDNIKYVENARPGHDFRYSINHSKITKELGWEPKVSMVEAVTKTVDWYLKNQEWVKKIKTGEYQEINDKYRN